VKSHEAVWNYFLRRISFPVPFILFYFCADFLLSFLSIRNPSISFFLNLVFFSSHLICFSIWLIFLFSPSDPPLSLLQTFLFFRPPQQVISTFVHLLHSFSSVFQSRSVSSLAPIFVVLDKQVRSCFIILFLILRNTYAKDENYQILESRI